MWGLFTDGPDWKVFAYRLSVAKQESLRLERESWSKGVTKKQKRREKRRQRQQFTRAIGYR